MLNQIVLVGRLVREPEIRETESGKKVTDITLAVPRSYKNLEGEYDTDFVPITLWDGVAANTAEYVKKGDILGVKGRIQNNNYEDKDGNMQYKISVVAEKVTFLSNAKENREQNEAER